MKLIQVTLLAALGICYQTQGFAPSSFKKLVTSNTGLQSSSQDHQPGDLEPMVQQDRRSSLLSMAALGLAMTTTPLMAEAAPSKKGRSKTKPRTYFKGKITIKDGTEYVMGDYKAIFISARPKNPATIPPEVVASARGGVPAVFFAVVKDPKFPAKFELTENDITPEGDFGLTSDPYWWAEDSEWEISARVDTDGVIRTLDPGDLVGRTITSQPGDASPDTEVCVAVKERGFFGSYYQKKD